MRPPFDIDFAFKGFVGTLSPFLGIVTSFQEQIEWHLRIASLLVGIAVGGVLPRRDDPQAAGAALKPIFHQGAATARQGGERGGSDYPGAGLR